MGDQRACSFHTSTSGRARNGSADLGFYRATSLGSGSSSATTTEGIRGASSGTSVISDTPIAARPRLEWRVATVLEVRDETPRTRKLILDVPQWPGHRAGQHVDVRLVAEDGYQAQRSYSIASAPEDSTLALTVERLDDGEVSPYLCSVLVPGDGVEVRGPIGGYFVWDVAEGGPLLLVAGGSGVVPLMSMLRHHQKTNTAGRTNVPAKLVYSVRALEDVIYRDELARIAERPQVDIVLTLTRVAPNDWTGYRRRIDRAMLEEVGWPASAQPHVYVCGPTSFVESVATLLVDLGHDATRVRTERFGPTG